MTADNKTAADSVRWNWSGHWHQEHPAGWDGQHELTVRAHGLNDGSDVILSCSCGRQARFSPARPGVSARDDGNAAVLLTVLTGIAAAHLRESGAAL